VEAVYERFQKSLEYLGVERLHGLLVHRAADLLGPHGDRLFERLSACQSAGQMLRFGVSVYTPEEAFLVVDRYPLTLIQFPLNALDQRMVASGALRFLRERGLELHARSIFLQGVLLAEPEGRGVSADLAPYIARFREIASFAGMTSLEAALAFVAGQDIDVAIVGVTSHAEFSEIAAAFKRCHQLECPSLDFFIADSRLIDPRHWSARA
ncbi:MAG: aldo/keto reductase, partial [Candidatus Competibacter sp.]|nr:aldo/keto reductase [Candidatus Competibacter sp.]